MSLPTEFIFVFVIGRYVYKAYMRWPGDHS